MRYFKAFLLPIAVLGGVASTAAHLLSWIGVGDDLLSLAIGPLLALMLVVALVAAGMSHLAGRGGTNDKTGQRALSGCPRWMRMSLRMLGVYVLLSVPTIFIVYLFVLHGHEHAASASQTRLFTAVAMLVFWTASGVFYSFLHNRKQSDQPG